VTATGDGAGPQTERTRPPAPPSADGRAEREAATSTLKNTVSSNVAVTVGSKLLYMATRLVTPPIILAYVTLPEYGLWATCFILISYVGMGAFGVSNVYIRYSAEFAARGETGRINRLVSTGLTVLTGFGLVVLGAVWLGLPSILRAFKVPAELHTVARLLFVGTVAAFVLDLTLGAVAYVLTGLQRIALVNGVWVVAFLLETALTLAFLFGGLGIASLLWAFVARSVFSVVAHWVLLRRALPGFAIRIPSFDRESLRLFAGYGTVVQLSGLFGMVLRSIEKVIAGTFIGVETTALFDLGEKFPMMGTQIGFDTAFSSRPRTTSRGRTAGRDPQALRQGRPIHNVVCGIMMAYMTAFAAPLIGGWMGSDPKYVPAILILAVFPIAWQMNLLTDPARRSSASGAFAGLVYPRQAILVAVSVAAGFAAYGRTVPVVAVAVSASMVASALVYLAYANRQGGLSQEEWSRKVLLPGLTPYLVAGAIFLAATPALGAAHSGRGWAVALVLVTGTVHTAISGFLFYRFHCDWGEREFLRKQAAHTLARSSPRQGSGRARRDPGVPAPRRLPARPPRRPLPAVLQARRERLGRVPPRARDLPGDRRTLLDPARRESHRSEVPEAGKQRASLLVHHLRPRRFREHAQQGLRGPARPGGEGRPQGQRLRGLPGHLVPGSRSARMRSSRRVPRDPRRPPGAVVAGVPAKVVGTVEETVRRLGATGPVAVGAPGQSPGERYDPAQEAEIHRLRMAYFWGDEGAVRPARVQAAVVAFLLAGGCKAPPPITDPSFRPITKSKQVTSLRLGGARRVRGAGRRGLPDLRRRQALRPRLGASGAVGEEDRRP
jgi:O-antigen/teichoic acid export membrane protein